MLLRGQVPEDLLEFYPEIEKTVRKNQSKKREEKKKQGQKKRIFQHSQLTQSNRVPNG